MKTLPSGLELDRQTREFTEETVPTALLRRHYTKEGVWGRICVQEGLLRYRILEPEIEEHVLSPDQPGIVEPQVPHLVEPVGSVRFFVEFHKAPK